LCCGVFAQDDLSTNDLNNVIAPAGTRPFFPLEDHFLDAPRFRNAFDLGGLPAY